MNIFVGSNKISYLQHIEAFKTVCDSNITELQLKKNFFGGYA